ncbi:hypothetical protein A2U01_0056981, partial [Trifolium medium]|nr:hypothetical protein [Trifolium medium]
AWIYHHFNIIGEEDIRYEEDLSRGCKFDPTRGQTNVNAVRKTIDRLLPHDVDSRVMMAIYQLVLWLDQMWIDKW